MGRLSATPIPPEWTVDELDLEAYWARLDYRGPMIVDGATLAQIHRAHIATIPFENLDVIIGRRVSVELARIQAKLVDTRRGGYCYEHGLLLGAVLTRLGYTVRRQLARIGGDLAEPRPRTHCVLLVSDGSERWLADVGFGAGLLEPLPLQADLEVSQGAWVYRLVQPQASVWQLQERLGTESDHIASESDWTTLYTFTEEDHHLADVVMSNHYTSTWPESPFVQRSIVIRKDNREVRELIGRTFRRVRPGEPLSERRLADHEVGPVLHDLGIELDGPDLQTLIAALPD